MINAIINHAGKEVEVNIAVNKETVGMAKPSHATANLLLTKINIDLFTSLYIWGASKEKICHALQININEFDTLQGMLIA
jgi:hypothetical protein